MRVNNISNNNPSFGAGWGNFTKGHVRPIIDDIKPLRATCKKELEQIGKLCKDYTIVRWADGDLMLQIPEKEHYFLLMHGINGPVKLTKRILKSIIKDLQQRDFMLRHQGGNPPMGLM